MKHIVPFAVVLAVLTLAGCAVGPNYSRPRVSVPEQWTVVPARGTSSKEPVMDAWWQSFGDPELDSLIKRAAANNLDLKIALERVAEARAAGGIARSGYFPNMNADVSAVRLRGGFEQGEIHVGPSSPGSKSSPSLISAFETNVFQGDLNASWELDVFGQVRRSVQAARAGVAAENENRRDVIVILLGDVGETYAQLRGYQRRLEIANENIRIQQETLDLTKERANAGLATDLDVSRAAAQLDVTKAAVPTLRGGIDVSIHRLSVLLGEEPGALRSELERAGAIPTRGPHVDVGLPSDLLERRPDIREAEAEVVGATARVAEAKAERFPSFVLTGTAGRQATQLHDLTLGLGNFFSVGPAISLPLFTGGRIHSNIEVQEAREREAVTEYHSTLLKALEEVENALVNYSEEQDRRDRLNQAVKQSQLAVTLADEQYRAGLTDFLSVLEAQRDLYANEDQLALSQTNVTSDLVSLYRALGGGWNVAGLVAVNKPLQ